VGLSEFCTGMCWCLGRNLTCLKAGGTGRFFGCLFNGFGWFSAKIVLMDFDFKEETYMYVRPNQKLFLNYSTYIKMLMIFRTHKRTLFNFLLEK
jgi:hypothetical protein